METFLAMPENMTFKPLGIVNFIHEELDDETRLHAPTEAPQIP